jgi:hypothetical protein
MQEAETILRCRGLRLSSELRRKRVSTATFPVSERAQTVARSRLSLMATGITPSLPERQPTKGYRANTPVTVWVLRSRSDQARMMLSGVDLGRLPVMIADQSANAECHVRSALMKRSRRR